MIMLVELERTGEKLIMDYFKVLSQHLLGGTEENHIKSC
jgi:hypothetical protein